MGTMSYKDRYKYCTSIMYDPSKDSADNERVLSGLYAGKQGFRPGRANLCAVLMLLLSLAKTENSWDLARYFW